MSSQSQAHRAPERAPTPAPLSEREPDDQDLLGNSFLAGGLGLPAASQGIFDWFEDEETPEEIAAREQAEFLAKTWPATADFETGTGGTFDGSLVGPILFVTLKVAYDFVPGNPSDAPVGTPPAELQWSPAQQAAFKADYASLIFGTWSFQHPIRSTRPNWNLSISTMVTVQEDDADPHFKITVSKLPVDAGDGKASVCDDGTHHNAARDSCPANPPGVDGGTAIMDSRDNDVDRVRNGSQPVIGIFFDIGSSDIPAAQEAKLDAPANQLTTNPDWNAELTGRASARGPARDNFLLARQREQAVSGALTGKGVNGSQLMHSVEGEQDAGRTDFDQRVDVHVIDVQSQATAAHETGHMFGLGDEYIHGGESPGDPLPADYQQLIADNVDLPAGGMPTKGATDSIMSNGSEVQNWHYAPFVALLKDITGSEDWTV